LRWAAAASLILVLFAGGLTAASASSVPGEALYPVKQWVEQVELATAWTDSARVSVYLNHAERRAREALVLLDRAQPEPSLVAAARANLNAAQQLAQAAGDAERAGMVEYAGRLSQVDALIEFVADGAPGTLPSAAPTNELPGMIPPSDTPVPTPTFTPMPTRTPTGVEPTRTRRPPNSSAARTATAQAALAETTPTPLATSFSLYGLATATPDPTDCPGNSCNSAGVPGGQIDPQNPTGQSGGRSDNPPVPPGQGNPGGGGNSPPGQGRGNDNGGGNDNPPGNDNPGGGASPPEVPPGQGGENPAQGNPNPGDPPGQARGRE
jgi:hypothetical protein